MPSPAPLNSHLSRVTSDGEDNVFLSWVTESDGTAELAFARLAGESWTDEQTIGKGSDWFINWADFPALSVSSDTRVAHWLQRSATGTYDYDVAARFYSGAGGAWSEPRILHSDGVSAEHGFVAMAPMGAGSTLISWLDGRNTKDQPTPGPMTLRAGIYDAAGRTVNEWELDPAVCDCCTTSAAMTTDGPVVVYRDRTADEIRDIAITRFVDERWTEPQVVHADNWRIAGCPVNGPAVAARGSTVAVAWFTAQNDRPRVQLALSGDSGASFAAPVPVAGSDTSGRVDAGILNNGDIVVSWLAVRGPTATVMLSHFSAQAEPLAQVEVATTSASRRSGFPVMETVGNTAYVTWTDISAEPAVKVARVRF